MESQNDTQNTKYALRSSKSKHSRFSQNPRRKLVRNNSWDFSDLPAVCLVHIFRHLTVKDRLNASLACKKWRSVLFSNACLWNNFSLTLYLCKSRKSSLGFKMDSKILNFSPHLTLKYDLFSYGFFLRQACDLFEKINSKSLKSLSFIPCSLDKHTNEINVDFSLSKRFAELLNKTVLNAKSIEHLALGDCFLSAQNQYEHKIKHERKELIQTLEQAHSAALKSLHLSTSDKTAYSFNNVNSNADTNAPVIVQSELFLSNYLCSFTNLTCLSIDYDDLNDEYLNSTVCVNSLKR